MWLVCVCACVHVGGRGVWSSSPNRGLAAGVWMRVFGLRLPCFLLTGVAEGLLRVTVAEAQCSSTSFEAVVYRRSSCVASVYKQLQGLI